MKILVVDDNRDLADGLSELMELYGHEVDVAFNGNDGLAAAGRKRYDVFFIDVGLPDITGLECARRIRNAGMEARILLMTGYSRPDLSASLDEFKDTELLTKPIDPETLLAVVC